jgi:hypothetical protein
MRAATRSRITVISARHRADCGGYLHRFLLSAPAGVQVDHINRDTQDMSKKKNLRLATRSQSRANRGVMKNNSTGYTGVLPSKTVGKFIARLSVDRKPRHLGTFSGAKTAAVAYDLWSLKIHDEYASLNFPELRKAAKPLIAAALEVANAA